MHSYVVFVLHVIGKNQDLHKNNVKILSAVNNMFNLGSRLD